MNKEQGIITFPSVYHAFRAKKILEDAGISVKLIPIPRELSGSCEGLAVSVDGKRCDEVLTVLDNNGIKTINRGITI